MGDLKIDPFNQLLNEISHKLREENLRSLIHISGVPGAIESSMKDGLTFFKYLKEVDVISKENVGNLRNLLRKMRPKRRDLVLLVDEYIKKEFNTDNVSLVVGEWSDSWEPITSNLTTAQSETGTQGRALVNLDCNYMYCGCRGFPSCYAPLIILLILAIIFTAVFWYANVPRVTKPIKANEDLKDAGVYIIILECIFLVVLVARYVWLNCRHRNYARFDNPTVQNELLANPLANDVESGRPVSSQPRRYKYSTGYGSYSGTESPMFSESSRPTPDSVFTDNEVPSSPK